MYKYRVCLAAEYRAVARHKNVRVSYSLACLPTPDAPGQEDHEVGLKEYKKIYVLFLSFFGKCLCRSFWLPILHNDFPYKHFESLNI